MGEVEYPAVSLAIARFQNRLKTEDSLLEDGLKAQLLADYATESLKSEAPGQIR